MMDQESGWEELRKEARKIEGDLDVKLSSYAKLGARVTQGGFADADTPTMGSNRSWKSMEMEIQSLLEKLLDVNDSMSRCAASAAPTTSVTQKLARHRDILHEFSQEFRRIKGNISAMTEHAELLSSVRDDISEFKASGSMSPRMQILRERAAIHGSIAHMDDVITQAQTTRAALGSQRAMFGDVQGKVKQLSDKFPIVRGLIGSIRRKKSRDTLILSAVIAAYLDPFSSLGVAMLLLFLARMSVATVPCRLSPHTQVHYSFVVELSSMFAEKASVISRSLWAGGEALKRIEVVRNL